MRVLHHYPLSPSSRLIRLYMNEKKIEFVTKLEIFWERNEKFLKLNPSGEVPVLIDLDNTVLCGSRIIVEYFEDLDKDIILIPGMANEKAEVRRLFDWFDNKFYREVTKVIIRELIDKYYQKDELDNTSPNMELVRLAQENSYYHFDYISHLINSRRWIGGDALSQADFAAAAHISCLDYLGKVDWDRWVTLKNWYARIKSRPSFSPILEDNIAGFRPPAYYSNPDF